MVPADKLRKSGVRTVQPLPRRYREPTSLWLQGFGYWMTHSNPTIPDAARFSRSSVKDTLFLSKAESEWVEAGRGGVVALRPEQ